jgi:CDP-glucose 4,6-dehydratase
VTGGRGLLGAWLVKALLDRGVRAVVLTNDGDGPSALELDGTDRRCAIEAGDVRDAAAVERVLDAHGVDTVFHLAAQSIVAESERRPDLTFDVNVGGTRAVLDACRRHGAERIVVAGTTRVYGPNGGRPSTEDHALRPRTPYDASKAEAEALALASGLPVAATRVANVYGGGDRQATRLVPTVVGAAAWRGHAPELRTDGSPRHDFVYVEDAVAAYLAIAGAMGDGARGQVFNVGAGRPVAVRDVVALVCGGAPQGGPDGPCEWVDTARLTALTGWTPGVSLEEGLRRTVAWYRRHPDALAPAMRPAART